MDIQIIIDQIKLFGYDCKSDMPLYIGRVSNNYGSNMSIFL